MPQRILELESKSQAPDIWDDQKAANALFSELKALKFQWEPVSELSEEVGGLIELIKEAEESDRESMEEETEKLLKRWEELETKLYLSGEFDMNNCYLSISGGAGGTEAQDWAEMLLRMYLRYCERQGWQTSVLEKTDGQEAGIKSVTVHVVGSPAYGYLKCERGTHRLVRLSPFNAKNLRQTSFALVEVLPELTEAAEVDIDEKELRVDTYRSSGAGGQHVNKTDSAVRITHEPSGIVVACQNERSQQQNRVQAMNMLRAKLLEKQREEEAKTKEGLKGATKSADFGQQIRSYVLHPYQMVKDLRTDTETSDTEGVLDGDLQEFVDAELKQKAKG
ncbi:peptide chain release factor 2 [Patescibacteria group bacterium]|nr:peptide chain release factor 2 [Patescibacteria group bacterium]MBU2259105.1 peptide chain release factor 2 [Patescibacteria group bacterium]